MKYLGSKTLETERLILRKIKVEDALTAFNNWCNSDVVDKYVLWVKHPNIQTTIKQFQHWVEAYNDEKTFRWIVELKEDHDLLGTIDVSTKFIEYGTCSIGYCYSEKYWNKGYATEALKRVIKYLFEECDADVVFAEHMENNPASGRVMEKSGMIYEGRTRKRLIDKDNIRNDLLSYSILKEEYFINSFKQDQSHYSLLGDFILELRFSAKFHLQMCAVLSQASRHVDALKHAKLAALMCEDNLMKTNYLYIQMRNKNFYNDNNNDENDEENQNFNEKIKESYKIISELFNRVLKVRGNEYASLNEIDYNINGANHGNDVNNNYFKIENKKSVLNPSSLAYSLKKDNNNNAKNKPKTFTSYTNYRNSEINNYNSNNTLINNIRNIFGNSIKKDDWIQLLNIGNIMYLSALNYEDLDLDSDPKYELLRDAILEKVVMLTVSYFCIATELRLLSPNKTNKKLNGEYFHYKAVEFSSLFLPVSCPIVKHYVISYYKHYGQDMDIVPEGKTVDTKINLLRSEIEQDKETLSFVRIENINYIKKPGNNGLNNNSMSNLALNSNNSQVKSDISCNNSNIPKANITLNLALALNSTNKKLNNNLIQKNNIEVENNSNNININANNGNFGILANNNCSNIAAKSKINLENAPKFKLNFENLKNDEDNDSEPDYYEETRCNYHFENDCLSF